MVRVLFLRTECLQNVERRGVMGHNDTFFLRVLGTCQSFQLNQRVNAYLE